MERSHHLGDGANVSFVMHYNTAAKDALVSTPSDFCEFLTKARRRDVVIYVADDVRLLWHYQGKWGASMRPDLLKIGRFLTNFDQRFAIVTNVTCVFQGRRRCVWLCYLSLLSSRLVNKGIMGTGA